MFSNFPEPAAKNTRLNTRLNSKLVLLIKRLLNFYSTILSLTFTNTCTQTHTYNTGKAVPIWYFDIVQFPIVCIKTYCPVPWTLSNLYQAGKKQTNHELVTTENNCTSIKVLFPPSVCVCVCVCVCVGVWVCVRVCVCVCCTSVVIMYNYIILRACMSVCFCVCFILYFGMVSFLKHCIMWGACNIYGFDHTNTILTDWSICTLTMMINQLFTTVNSNKVTERKQKESTFRQLYQNPTEIICSLGYPVKVNTGTILGREWEFH